MRTALVLFTRDLRLHDNPTLTASLNEAENVVPLFVVDERIQGTRYGRADNRAAFLGESLADLDASLRAKGGRLVVRHGEVVAEAVKIARQTEADAIFVSGDVSPYARERESKLAAVLDLRVVDATFVVPAGAVAPEGGDHYRVFTPYHRAWSQATVGDPLPAPRRIRVPDSVTARRDDERVLHQHRGTSRLPSGGETAGTERARRWLRDRLDGYGVAGHDDLAADATSRLSPYLHFGCVSARALAVRALGQGGEAFVRQLCWRDFYAQLLWGNPRSQTEDLRPRGDRWVDDEDGLAAWQEGATGYPLVDAGMRQLREEGWMHNRARLVAASFLVKDLGLDWREGARHFFDLLLDGDVAQNVGNWQWVAGTGADTRPNRVFNPTAQAKRLDPTGAYVRRYVPELADLEPPDVFEPRMLASGYPAPIVDHAEAARAFRERRGTAF